MPRRLPWQTNNADATGTRSSAARSTPIRSTPVRRIARPILDSSDIEQDQAYTSRPRNSSLRAFRQPTTTPTRDTPTPENRFRTNSPGQRLQPPPKVFMVPGWGNDDRYRMVEDEFLDIAKEFTQHLHAAEYLRLKAAARAKSSTTNIARPVSGALMPSATKRKLESIKRAKRPADAIRWLKEEKDRVNWENEGDIIGAEEAPEPWLGTALAGLMEERSQVAPISGGIMGKESRSKPAADANGKRIEATDEMDFLFDKGEKGRTEAEGGEETESEGDDDDLDATVVKPLRSMGGTWQAKVTLPLPPPRPIRAARQPEPPSSPPQRSSPPPQPESKAALKAGMMFKLSVASAINQEESPFPLAVSSPAPVELPRTSADVLARLARRRKAARLKRARQEEEKKEEEMKKRSGDGDGGIIPTFL